MSPYRLPSSTATILDNPRVSSTGNSTRVPAIVALGPTTRSISFEAVQRGSGSIDYLSVYSTVSPASGVSVSSVSNLPAVPPSVLNGLYVGQNGVLYNVTSSGSVNTSGYIQWQQTASPSVDIPASGSIYYVTYTYNAPSSQYTPYLASDKNLIVAKYGSEDNVTGLLSIGGSLAIENGAPSAWLVQASGSVFSAPAYYAAIDTLKKKNNVEQLVILFPSGSVSRAAQENVFNYAIAHVAQMNAQGRERGLMCGSPSTYYTSDGLSTIGDQSTSGTYIYRATALRNRDIVYIVPSRAQRASKNGATPWELDGNFIAAAVAGLQCSTDHRSTPIHGQVLAGLTISDDMFNDSELLNLGGNGCLVVKSTGGVVSLEDQITTDPTSADTAEISVISQSRLVKRTLRDGVTNTFINQGVVISPTVVSSVEANVATNLQSLVQAGEIYAYGLQDNPATGEVAIVARQDLVEPRQVDITCSVKYLYPFKWSVITISTFI